MTDYIKLFTSETFDKELFTNTMRYKFNVRAASFDDGIVLDREAFNAIPIGLMPTWVYRNKSRINSRLCTRPATTEEIAATTEKPRYVLQVYSIYTDQWHPFESSNDAAELVNRIGVYTSFNNCPMIVVDNATGEIIAENNGLA